MGGCPSHCEVRCGNGMRYEGSTLELNFEQQRKKERARSASSSRQGESVTLAATHQFPELEREFEVYQTPSDPKNEIYASNIEIECLPQFVVTKQINNSAVQERQNRFMQDLEIEVRARIKEIQREEEEIRQQILIQNIVRKQLEFEQKKKNQNDQISIDFLEHESPKHPSYKNTSRESKESQPASNQSKSAINSSEQQQSNKNLSQPLLTDPNKQSTFPKTKAMQKLMSNFYLENQSCESDTNNKKKGILKQHQQLKYAHTTKSLPNKRFRPGYKKRVHFSHDTNFTFEKKSEGTGHRSWWKSIF